LKQGKHPHKPVDKEFIALNLRIKNQNVSLNACEFELDTVVVGKLNLLTANLHFLIRCLRRTLHFSERLLRRASNGAYFGIFINAKAKSLLSNQICL
jgi:hypothetical protein